MVRPIRPVSCWTRRRCLMSVNTTFARRRVQFRCNLGYFLILWSSCVDCKIPQLLYNLTKRKHTGQTITLLAVTSSSNRRLGKTSHLLAVVRSTWKRRRLRQLSSTCMFVRTLSVTEKPRDALYCLEMLFYAQKATKPIVSLQNVHIASVHFLFNFMLFHFDLE